MTRYNWVQWSSKLCSSFLISKSIDSVAAKAHCTAGRVGGKLWAEHVQVCPVRCQDAVHNRLLVELSRTQVLSPGENFISSSNCCKTYLVFANVLCLIRGLVLLRLIYIYFFKCQDFLLRLVIHYIYFLGHDLQTIPEEFAAISFVEQ